MNRLVATWARLPTMARVAILSVLVLGIWLLLVGHTLGNTPIFGYIRGGTADWIVTREAWVGNDAYAPLGQLAEQHLGWLDVEPSDPHPRPPSALLLLGPLGLVPPDAVILALAVASAVALSVWISASVRWAGLAPGAEFLIVPVALTPPSLHSVVWGSEIPLMAAFLALALIGDGRKGVRAGGISFASGFKLFPFLLAFASNRGRARVIVLAGSMFLGLTLAGSLLPGVDLAAAVSSLLNAPGAYGTSDVSLSLTSVLGWGPGAVIFPLAGVVALLVASRHLSSRGSTSLALIAMVVFAPYAWPEYMILWVPALLHLWKLGTAPRLAVLLFLCVIALTRDGRILLIAGLTLGCVLIFAELTLRRRDRSAAATQLAV